MVVSKIARCHCCRKPNCVSVSDTFCRAVLAAGIAMASRHSHGQGTGEQASRLGLLLSDSFASHSGVVSLMNWPPQPKAAATPAFTH
ncbi:hypothetical protein [Azospirillum soli]|uniref:hypothetical protein n=1 Tax=Azospirillum soli TaxID=1304799 RepID=UPI001AE3F935|nr:hypothetical protein [Azospirillum soli]MBP2315334.1 hypothetical protein [Azospirillum soli]